jgi:hypothetical protein
MRARVILGVATLAIATRCAMLLFVFATHRLPPQRLPQVRDGATYLAYAQAVTAGHEGFDHLSPYDRRVFPGYPLVLAALHAYAAPAIAVFVNVLAATAAAVLTLFLFDDRRVALAMATLTPSYVMYSTTVMTEPLVLALGLAALVAAPRARGTISGALLGVVALTRPLAVPLGVAYVVGQHRDRRNVAACIIGCAVVMLAGAIWFGWWSGHLLAGVEAYRTNTRAYGTYGIFSLPFASLFAAPIAEHAPLWKIIYVWAHVAAVLAGFVLLLRERPRPAREIAWLASNTAIVLCIGGRWGFDEFHRFIIPALPPLFFAWRNVLPRSASMWCAIAAVSALLGGIGLGHGW